MNRNQRPPGVETMTIGHGVDVMRRRDIEKRGTIEDRLERIEAGLAAILGRLENQNGGNADADS